MRPKRPAIVAALAAIATGVLAVGTARATGLQPFLLCLSLVAGGAVAAAVSQRVTEAALEHQAALVYESIHRGEALEDANERWSPAQCALHTEIDHRQRELRRTRHNLYTALLHMSQASRGHLEPTYPPHETPDEHAADPGAGLQPGTADQSVDLAEVLAAEARRLGKDSNCAVLDVHAVAARVQGNPAVLSLMVRHALTHAVEASASRGRIIVTLRATTNAAVLTIDSHTSSIARDRLDSLAATMRQGLLDTHSPRLSTCAALAVDHRGSARIKEIGRGTLQFRAELPLATRGAPR